MDAGFVSDLASARSYTLRNSRRQCIQQLPPHDRSLILRCYFDGFSLGRVAEEVGRKAEDLKGSLHRIRLGLRTCVRRKTELRKAMS